MDPKGQKNAEVTVKEKRKSSHSVVGGGSDPTKKKLSLKSKSDDKEKDKDEKDEKASKFTNRFKKASKKLVNITAIKSTMRMGRVSSRRDITVTVEDDVQPPKEETKEVQVPDPHAEELCHELTEEFRIEAWDICMQRHSVLHGDEILVNELRNAWHRVMEINWLDSATGALIPEPSLFDLGPNDKAPFPVMDNNKPCTKREDYTYDKVLQAEARKAREQENGESEAEGVQDVSEEDDTSIRILKTPINMTFSAILGEGSDFNPSQCGGQDGSGGVYRLFNQTTEEALNLARAVESVYEIGIQTTDEPEMDAIEEVVVIEAEAAAQDAAKKEIVEVPPPIQQVDNAMLQKFFYANQISRLRKIVHLHAKRAHQWEESFGNSKISTITLVSTVDLASTASMDLKNQKNRGRFSVKQKTQKNVGVAPPKPAARTPAIKARK